jgi:hypothetical protein
MTEDSLSTTTEATEATEEKKLEMVKKPRTPAQVAALEAARQKAFAIRAERKKEKTQASATLIEKQDPISEPEEEEVEYVKKARAKPKAKKRIVVVEESSSEDEIEIRLPKRKNEVDASRRPDERQLKLEASMTKMFTL